jgi:hypothetical protein
MHTCFSINDAGTFATVGSKHIKFWSVSSKAGEAGLFEGKGEQTSFACVAYDD